jgi:predicted DNA-binding transcriptional regulator AlpA
MNTATPSESRFGRTREACAILMCCPRSLNRWAAEGLIPKPVRLTARKLLWDLGAIRAFLEQKANTTEGNDDAAA